LYTHGKGNTKYRPERLINRYHFKGHNVTYRATKIKTALLHAYSRKRATNSMHVAKIDKSPHTYSIIQIVLKLAALSTRLLKAKCNSFTCVH
jgi:ribosomal protein S8E